MIRKLIIGVLCFMLLGIALRLLPVMLPIARDDITRETFHSVKFLDRNGDLLQEVLSADSRRSVYVDIEDVSPYFVQAMIATEDRRFYEHGGVDYRALGRAVWQNLQAAQVVSGASTISLQLARLLEPAERSLWNKATEAFRAWRLEAGMSKKEILQEYLNRLPMGGNLYGIEGAARAYFGVPAADLTLAQSSFLATIPNSPNRLNPYQNLPGIRQRQRTVLQRMSVNGMIDTSRIEDVLKEDVLLKAQTSSFAAPHFVFGLLPSLSEGEHTLKTTIDPLKQQMVREQIQVVIKRLKRFNVTNAGAILIDNHTGEVLAYVGSADFFNEKYGGQNDAIRSLRQPGSTLKPFLYLMALEQGFHPATIISDIPTHYKMPSGIYSPKNYSESFRGPVRLREALANSLNVPAVRVGAKVGVSPFLQRLREHGFESLTETADHYGVGLVLGGGEVTMLELARAYVGLARSGKQLPLKMRRPETTDEQHSPSASMQISKPEYNYLIGNILSDPFARAAEYGFDSVLNLPFQCSAKTGTSWRFCDNWTMGFTEDYTLGVWVGNFDHSPMMNVSGVTGAGPIFANIMYQLYTRREKPQAQPMPEGLVREKICPLSGKRHTENCPSVFEEMLPENQLAVLQKTPCQMHQTSGDDVPQLPARYLSWASGLGVEAKADSGDADAAFRIVNPQEGATYLRMSYVAGQYQSIRFEMNRRSPESKVHWLLNGEPLETTVADHEILWQSRPGEYKLTAIADSDQSLSSSVSFTVK